MSSISMRRHPRWPASGPNSDFRGPRLPWCVPAGGTHMRAVRRYLRPATCLTSHGTAWPLAPRIQPISGRYCGQRVGARRGLSPRPPFWSWPGWGPSARAHYPRLRRCTPGAGVSSRPDSAASGFRRAIGSVSEVFDGDAPHIGRAAASRRRGAWLRYSVPGIPRSAEIEALRKLP